jgi:O-antigen/teichoic acid export membrane protein
MALLVVVVNTMVFVSGFGTMGVGWLTSIPVGVVIGIITFMAQKKWYGDDPESALIKALIVAFLTAIPTSLPGYLTIPSGIVGFFRRKEV